MNIEEVLDGPSRPEPALGRGTDEQPIRLEDACAKEYRPSRTECLRDYQIGIKFLSVGCIISVSCKEVPFTSIKEGMAALNNYVVNPYETRKI